jgi:hypothetical protein
LKEQIMAAKNLCSGWMLVLALFGVLGAMTSFEILYYAECGTGKRPVFAIFEVLSTVLCFSPAVLLVVSYCFQLIAANLL